ncbi:MAG: hypothetical protein RIF41_35110 [Polyangiaceae bacterium]
MTRRAAMNVGRLAAKARRREAESGAAVFVVVLVITLLTALGLFAVREATTAVSASGYNRQLTQVHYVTDMAVMAAVADLATNPTAVADQMRLGPQTGEAECAGYSDPTQLFPTCWLRSYDDLDDTVQKQSANSKNLLQSDSLGYNQLEADMRIELTDLHPAQPVRGNQVAGGATAANALTYVYVTVSANGIVRPPQAAAGTWDQHSAQAAGTEQARAHVFMGPVLMQR